MMCGGVDESRCYSSDDPIHSQWPGTRPRRRSECLLRNPFAARLAAPGGAKYSAVPADQATIPGVEAERYDGMFAALRRYPTYRKLWVGMLCASLGQWMQNVALAWIALDLTDSEFFVGLVGFMAGLPFLVVSIPAGVLVDRMDR